MVSLGQKRTIPVKNAIQNKRISVPKAYVTNHLGSVLNSAVAGNFHSYGYFGESTASGYAIPKMSASAPAVMWGFAGMMSDTTSGNYQSLGGRMYNPAMGRWMQQDPIGLAGGMNQYVYADNRSLTRIDPFGFDAIDLAYATDFVRLKAGTAFNASFSSSLGADTAGRTSLISKDISINEQQFGGSLTDGERVALLITLFHEVQHVNESRISQVADMPADIYSQVMDRMPSPTHRAIYEKAGECGRLYQDEFLSGLRQYRTQNRRIFEGN